MARPRVYKVRPGPKRKTLADIEAGPITVVPEPQPIDGQFKAVRASYSNKRKSAIIIWHYTHQISRYDARSNTYVLRKPRFRDTWTHFHSELKSQGVPFSTMAGWLDRKMADKILTAKATSRKSDLPNKNASGEVIDEEVNDDEDEDDVEDEDEEMEEAQSEERQEEPTSLPRGQSQEHVVVTPPAPGESGGNPAKSSCAECKERKIQCHHSSQPLDPQQPIPQQSHNNGEPQENALGTPSAQRLPRLGPPRSSCADCRGRKTRCLHGLQQPTPPQFHTHGFSAPIIESIQPIQHPPRPETYRTVRGPQPLKDPRPVQYMALQSTTRIGEQGGFFHQPSQPSQPSPLGFPGQGDAQQVPNHSGYLTQLPPPASAQSTPSRPQEMRITHPAPLRYPSSVPEPSGESYQRPSTCPPGQPHPLGTPPNHRREEISPVAQPEAQQQQLPQQLPTIHQRSSSSMTEPIGANQASNTVTRPPQRPQEGQGVTLPSLVSQVALIPQRLQLMTQKSPIQILNPQPRVNRSQWPIVVLEPAVSASPPQPQTITDRRPLSEDQGQQSPRPAPQPQPQLQTQLGLTTVEAPLNQQMTNNQLPPPQPWLPPPPRIIEHLPSKKGQKTPATLAPKPSERTILSRPLITEERKTYLGTCHCSTVTFAVTCKPLPNPTHVFISCTCKTCAISNTLFLSSTTPSDSSSVTLHRGIESLTHFHGRSFCRNCGLTLFSHASPEMIQRNAPNLIMFNVRSLVGLEIDERLIIRKEWKERGPVGIPSVGLINRPSTILPPPQPQTQPER